MGDVSICINAGWQPQLRPLTAVTVAPIMATEAAAAALTSRVGTILLRTGSCHRCVLRFCGVRDVSCYTLSDAQLRTAAAQTAGGDESAAAGSDDSFCPLCLGMLQQTLSPASLDEIVADVRKTGYALSSFCLSVSVPPVLLVRQRGAWLHLRKHQQIGAAPDGGPTDFPFTDFGGVVDVKDPLRWLLSPRLAELLSRAPQAAGGNKWVRYDPGSAMTLTLTVPPPCKRASHGHSEPRRAPTQVTHPACSAEHESVVVPMLAAPSGYGGGGGKRQRRQDVPEADSTRTVPSSGCKKGRPPRWRTRPMRPPGASRGPGRSRAASASWKLAVASAARLGLRPRPGGPPLARAPAPLKPLPHSGAPPPRLQ